MMWIGAAGLVYGAVGMWVAMIVSAATAGPWHRALSVASFFIWPMIVLAGIVVTARQLIREHTR